MELKTKHSDAMKKWKEQIKRVDTGEGSRRTWMENEHTHL